MEPPPDNELVKVLTRQPASGDLVTTHNGTVSVCLVGGRTIVRLAIRKLLESPDITVDWAFDNEQTLAAARMSGQMGGFDLIVLIPDSRGLQGFGLLRDFLESDPVRPPVLVLGEQISRGQLYGALRIGAKAYVSLDSQPEELRQAIRLAAEGKMHLSRDAAEMMLSDMSLADNPSQAPGHAGGKLTARESEIVQLLCDGLSSRQIAGQLHLAPKTIENHRYNIYRKCEVGSIAGLIRFAVQNGLVTL